MVDSVVIDRATGATTVNAGDLSEVPVYATVYAGPARVQRSGALAARDSVVGGYEFDLDAVIVQAPLSAVGVLPGDRVMVTAVGAESDPDLLALVATVRGNLAKTHATKRTLVCEAVT